MRVTYNAEYERRIRAAFIGCGGHAWRNIYPTFAYAPVDLAAVCDFDRSRAEAAARQFGAGAAYTDYREILEKVRPEAVFVVTNYDENAHPRYPEIAIDAMRAGAHVWIEKPPAHSSDEIRRMREVERETGKFVMVGYKKMFFPANAKAHEIVARPEFGGVTSISARYPQHLPPADERADDGKMVGFLDHIMHPYSLLLLLAGRIAAITVQYNRAIGSSFTAIRFASGAIGGLHLAHGQSGMSFLERTEIVGRGQNVVVDNNVRLTWYRPGAPADGYGRTGSIFGADDSGALVWEPEFSLGQLYNKGIFLLGYAPEIRYFCDRVLDGRPPERAGLADALELLKIYEAYRGPDGREVAIPEG